MGDVNNIRFRFRRIQKTPDNRFKRELKDLYSDRSGKMYQMGKIERKQGFFQKIFWKIFIFLFLVSLGVAGVNFFLFERANTPFAGEKVDINVETPEKIPSGERFTLRLNFFNDADVPLKDAKIILQAPKNLEIFARNPETSGTDLTWELGSLAPGKRGNVEIEGALIGNIQEIGRFQATLVYTPSNFSSEFRREKAFSVEIVESSLSLRITAPEKVAVLEEFSLNVKLENTTEEIMTNFSITGVFPTGWVLQTAKPLAERDDQAWKVDSLAPGETFELLLTGSYEVSAPSGDKEFIINVERFSEAANKYVTQKTVSFQHKFIKDDLTLNLLNNGSTENSSVSFGDSLEYTLLYKNKGDTDLKDVMLRLSLVSDIIDWIRFDDAALSRIEGAVLYWESDKEHALKELKSADEGIIRVTLPLINNPEETNGKKYFAEAVLEASLDGGLSWPIESNHIRNTIETHVEISHEVSVTETGRFEIGLNLNNGLNELSDVLFKIPLSSEVLYESAMSVSAGMIEYDAAARVVFWKINRVPGKVTGLHALFRLRSGEENKQSFPLTGNILFSANNVGSGEKEEQTLSPLTVEN